MLMTIALICLAYLLGSISGSLLVGRLRRVDIREHGSGNAGGTNALRILGAKLALAVVAIDVGKGALAVWLAQHLTPSEAPLAPTETAFLAGLLAIVGHCWPLWHGFRGGKGGATLVGALILLWPLALLPVLAVWLLVLGLSGYVSAATILAAWAVPAFAGFNGDPVRLAFGLSAAALILFTHRSNLDRLLASNERRFHRARLLWPGRSQHRP